MFTPGPNSSAASGAVAGEGVKIKESEQGRYRELPEA